MNAVLACIAVITMLTAQTLWGASVAAVKLDMKEMDSLVKVQSHSSKVNDAKSLLHLFHILHAVVDEVLIGSIVGSGLVIAIVVVIVAVCICYLLYHSHVTKSTHYR